MAKRDLRQSSTAAPEGSLSTERQRPPPSQRSAVSLVVEYLRDILATIAGEGGAQMRAWRRHIAVKVMSLGILSALCLTQPLRAQECDLASLPSLPSACQDRRSTRRLRPGSCPMGHCPGSGQMGKAINRQSFRGRFPGPPKAVAAGCCSDLNSASRDELRGSGLLRCRQRRAIHCPGTSKRLLENTHIHYSPVRPRYQTRCASVGDYQPSRQPPDFGQGNFGFRSRVALHRLCQRNLHDTGRSTSTRPEMARL